MKPNRLSVPKVSLQSVRRLVEGFVKKIDPMRDWTIILALGIMLFVVSVVYNVVYFIGATAAVSYESTSAGVEASDDSIIRAIELYDSEQALLQVFQERTFLDPSKK
jgi:hypothetical protein